MVREEIKVKLEALMKDADFLDEIASCSSVDEVLEQFYSHGIDAAPVEIEEFLASQTVSVYSDELNAEDLEDVTGGSLLSAIYRWCKKVTGRSSGGGGSGAFGGGGGGGGGR